MMSRAKSSSSMARRSRYSHPVPQVKSMANRTNSPRTARVARKRELLSATEERLSAQFGRNLHGSIGETSSGSDHPNPTQPQSTTAGTPSTDLLPSQPQGHFAETPNPRQTTPPQRPGSHHLSHHHARRSRPEPATPAIRRSPRHRQLRRLEWQAARAVARVHRPQHLRGPPGGARSASAKSHPGPGSQPAADALRRSLDT